MVAENERTSVSCISHLHGLGESFLGKPQYAECQCDYGHWHTYNTASRPTVSRLRPSLTTFCRRFPYPRRDPVLWFRHHSHRTVYPVSRYLPPYPWPSRTGKYPSPALVPITCQVRHQLIGQSMYLGTFPMSMLTIISGFVAVTQSYAMGLGWVYAMSYWYGI